MTIIVTAFVWFAVALALIGVCVLLRIRSKQLPTATDELEKLIRELTHESN